MSDRQLGERQRRAIVLLSGGLDSTTTLAIAQDQGFVVTALSFKYGQRHAHEIEAAKRVAQALAVSDHVIVEIDLRQFGNSALTDSIEVPKHQSVHDIPDGIPATYVPARNTIMLSYALALAEVRQSEDVFIGVNSVDYSGYPDCRPEYVEAFQKLANLATVAGINGYGPNIHAPLMHLDKAQIIQRGLQLGVDYGLTSSCYDPDATGKACGACPSCLLRLDGFLRASKKDPIRYGPQT